MSYGTVVRRRPFFSQGIASGLIAHSVSSILLPVATVISEPTAEINPSYSPLATSGRMSWCFEEDGSDLRRMLDRNRVAFQQQLSEVSPGIMQQE